MIDHLMAFASQAAAQADPVVGQYWSAEASAWRGDVCIPSVFVWAPAQNTVDGNGNVVRHAYDSNWRLIISLPQANVALMALPSCHLVVDSDAYQARRPYIIRSVLTAGQLSQLSLEPTFMGRGYEFGSVTQADFQ